MNMKFVLYYIGFFFIKGADYRNVVQIELALIWNSIEERNLDILSNQNESFQKAKLF